MTTETESYRDWARGVRAEARRKIVALRAERLARKRAAEPTVPADDPPAAGPGLPLTVSRRTAAMLSPDAGSRAAGPPEPQDGAAGPVPVPDVMRDAVMDAGPAVAAEAPAEAPEPPAPQMADGADTAGQADPQLAEAGQIAPPETGADRPDAAPSAAPADGAPALTQEQAWDREPASDTAPGADHLAWDEETLRASDLNALPGIGTGLVWLLHANGVSSLEALAAADPATLSDQLGLVGRLIDLPSWIKDAQTRHG